jgi:hypothetical protein
MSENMENLPTLNEHAETSIQIKQEIPETSIQIRQEPQSELGAERERFEFLQRQAVAFAKSTLVPDAYQGNVANCFVALNFARRLNLDPLVFMATSYIVKGKPGIEGKLVIALINSRGPYPGGVQWEMSGSGDSRAATAFGIREDGRRDEFTVTYKQAKDAGWTEKNPNWRNLPDLMLHYRSATFLARTYFPELILGLEVEDERVDIGGGVEVLRRPGNLSNANKLLEEK